jgi:SAM-dependent methyltransferase
VGFPTDLRGGSPSVARPSRRQDEIALLAALADRRGEAIVELGAGDGARSASLLRALAPASYEAFEPSEILARVTAREISGAGGGNASVRVHDLARPIPVGEAAAGVALCLDVIEYLRMDELYMVLAEARRVLKPGGIAVLRGLSYGGGFGGSVARTAWTRYPSLASRLFGARRPLELHHYLSPEDWKVLDERHDPEGWFTRQTLALERL